LSPSDAGAHAGLAYWLVCQGRSDEALAWARRAQEIDPLTVNSIDVSEILFFSGRYDDAIRESRRNLTTNPNDPQALWSLGFPLIGAEQFDEAIHTLEKGLRSRWPPRGSSAGCRRTPAARAGGFPYPQPHSSTLISDLVTRSKRLYGWNVPEERSNIMQYLKVHPFFDLLRGDPGLPNICGG
jgi:tetratricopeptide (TPR) repeat protein